jgi:hypothetical protein
MRLRDIISEAPLADYQPLGDFSKPGPFRGVDKKLVPHPVNKLKTAQFFEQTPYDFRLFFSNISGSAEGNREYGIVSHGRVIQTFGDEVAQQIITGSESAITVVFMGNYGDAKVMLTPWVMAHRLGHAIQASQSRGNHMRSWQEVDQHFHKSIKDILFTYYGYVDGGRGGDLATRAALFNAIGTQRSSREKLIKRPYEFMYEMFAQYLKTGDVQLNPLPRSLGYGHQAWGKPTRNLNAHRAYPDDDLAHATDVLSNDMRILFGDVLAECEGKIFFM